MKDFQKFKPCFIKEARSISRRKEIDDNCIKGSRAGKEIFVDDGMQVAIVIGGG